MNTEPVFDLRPLFPSIKIYIQIHPHIFKVITISGYRKKTSGTRRRKQKANNNTHKHTHTETHTLEREYNTRNTTNHNIVENSFAEREEAHTTSKEREKESERQRAKSKPKSARIGLNTSVK